MRKLRGASLLEAIVSGVLFLAVFAAVMELLPGLTVRGDDALLVAAAEYASGRAFSKYGTGVWSCGEYTEEYDWGTIRVRVAAYRDFADIQQVEITALPTGSDKRVVLKQLVEWER